MVQCGSFLARDIVPVAGTSRNMKTHHQRRQPMVHRGRRIKPHRGGRDMARSRFPGLSEQIGARSTVGTTSHNTVQSRYYIDHKIDYVMFWCFTLSFIQCNRGATRWQGNRTTGTWTVSARRCKVGSGSSTRGGRWYFAANWLIPSVCSRRRIVKHQ